MQQKKQGKELKQKYNDIYASALGLFTWQLKLAIGFYATCSAMAVMLYTPTFYPRHHKRATPNAIQALCSLSLGWTYVESIHGLCWVALSFDQ